MSMKEMDKGRKGGREVVRKGQNGDKDMKEDLETC